MDSAFLKYIALCYHLSLRRAVVAGWVTWALCIVYLLATHGWDVTSMGGMNWIKHVFLLIPFAVFLLFFFLSHLGFADEMWWLDKMCIHQTRTEWKLAGVKALPGFVKDSKRLILLWSEDYFSRLWCCCEIATFLASHPPSDIVVQPLWLAPWMLSTICVDVLCGYVVAFLLETTFAYFSDTYGTWGPVPALAFTFGLGYSASIIPNLVAFRAKVRAHKQMLEQLENFSLDKCKCTIESDRAHVETHISTLYAQHAKPIEAFEATVHKDFQQVVVDSVGAGASMPLSLALLPFLPLYWSSMFDILACDGGPCEEIAPIEGFAAAWELVLAIAMAWTWCMCFCFPSIYPFIFWALGYTEELSTMWQRNIAGSFVILFAFTAAGTVGGVGTTIGYSVVATHGDPVWTTSLVLGCVFTTSLNYYLFFGAPEWVLRLIKG